MASPVDSRVAPIGTLERQPSDEASAPSWRRHEDLIHSLNGIVWEVDVRTMAFTFVSHQAEAMLGYPVAAWLDDPGFWVDHMHPDDRSWAPAFCEQETRKKSGHTFDYRML
ncbi:MAG TPA: PAS domain-containing protein, partial [Vicinamibacterales bacterium]